MKPTADMLAFFGPQEYIFFTPEDIEAVTGRKDPVLELFRPVSLDLPRLSPYHFPELIWSKELR